MSSEIEELLRQDAAAAGAFHASRPIPDPPTTVAPAGRPLTRVRITLFAAAVVAVLVAAFAVIRLGDRRAIAPAAPTPTAADVPTSPSPQPTPDTTPTSPTTSSSAAASTTTSAESPAQQAATAAEREAHYGILGAIPDGYRLVEARIQQLPEQTQTEADGSWSATYTRDIVNGEPLSYIQISIVPVIADDPYNGVAAGQPDVPLGTFTGRWTDETQFPGIASFAAPLGAGRLLLVSGRATHDEVASTVTNLQVDPSRKPPIVSVQVPDGFQLAYEGADWNEQATLSSTIVYAKGLAQTTAITVNTTIGPTRPAILYAIGPDLPRTVHVHDATGVLVGGQLIIDLEPGLQVSLHVGGPASWAFSENAALLTTFAELITTTDYDTFATYVQQTRANPFRPTDGDCEQYITLSNPRAESGTPAADGTIEVPTPGSITVTVTASQPLTNVDFFIEGLGKLTPIGHLDTLDGAQDVTLTWDGNIGDEPAPAAPYERVAVRADPANPNQPDVCNRHSDEAHLSTYSLPAYDYGSDFTIGAVFVVR